MGKAKEASQKSEDFQGLNIEDLLLGNVSTQFKLAS